MDKTMQELIKRKERARARIKKINKDINDKLAREDSKKRKLETRRKILVGSLVLQMLEGKEWPRDAPAFQAAMDQFLTRDQDRALFGLPPQKT